MREIFVKHRPCRALRLGLMILSKQRSKGWLAVDRKKSALFILDFQCPTWLEALKSGAAVSVQEGVGWSKQSR
jgi:hypothetical protein